VRDRPLLTRVDVSSFTGLEEKRGHVTRQESPRLWVHDIQTIMVDQHRLLLTPVCPALSADLGHNARSNLTRERRFLESLPFLPATRTRDNRHFDLLPRILDLRQTEEREQPKVNPPYVELIPLRLELGRVGIVMMVVVELFST
jgi:hypothetical protein